MCFENSMTHCGFRRITAGIGAFVPFVAFRHLRFENSNSSNSIERFSAYQKLLFNPVCRECGHGTSPLPTEMFNLDLPISFLSVPLANRC